MKGLLPLSLCVTLFVVPIFSGDRAQEEQNILETTLRHMFNHNASSRQSSVEAYYIGVPVGDKMGDPSDSFLRRFKGLKPVVKKLSECSASADKGVIDTNTSKSGLVFRVSRVRWKSDTETEVNDEYYEAGRSASGNTYYLQKENGRWRVVKDVMHWIS